MGISGMLKLYDKNEDLIDKFFSKYFTEEVKAINSIETNYSKCKSIAKEIDKDAIIIEVGLGGILSSLWRVLEDYKLGCEIFIEKIPVSQHAIEICEILNKNPYYLESIDRYIIITSNGNLISTQLQKENIGNSLIGITRSDNKKIIYQQGKTRNLDRAKKDETLK